MKTRSRMTVVIALLFSLFASYRAAAQVTANFSSSVTHSCSPLVAQFTDLSTGNPTSWRWDFGNGNISTQKNPGAIYLQPGFKTVTLIVSNGSSSDTLTMPNYIEVYRNPLVNFGASAVKGCAPLQVCFTDSTTPGSGTINKWIWDFGDGQGSTDQNPCITYNTPGTYSVSLYTEDVNGCSGSKLITQLIKVADVPVADFTTLSPRSSCTQGLAVQFHSTTTSGSSLSYHWSFGDGAIALTNGANYVYGYTQTGVFDVTLIATNAFGCKDTMVKPGFVAIEDLNAGFTSNTTRGCIGNLISFTDTSSSNPSTWLWNFGDGSTSTLENPQHAYSAAGTYTVTLVASNSPTCADTITKTSYIRVYPSPVAAFTASSTGGCTTPFTTTFTSTSQNAVRWMWDFGDSTTSTLANPTHTYTGTGSYTVTLTVTNTDSCTNTITKTNYIKVIKPKAVIESDVIKGCIPLAVHFTADSSTSVEPATSWAWNFGDGGTSTQRNPTHTYTANGVYTVTLIIQNSAGCRDTIVEADYIQAGSKPVAALTANPRQACLYFPVSFTSQTPNTNEWFWSFGDGGTSLMENPSYAYGDTGTFNVTLVATNNGCSDTVIMPNFVHISPPDAVFNTLRNCADPYTVAFQDQSLAPDTWFWSFGDGTSSTAANPVHTFAGRGTYSVSLTVTDTASGCSDIEVIILNITDPVAKFAAGVTTGCRPFTVAFTDSSIDAVSYRWETANMTSFVKNPSFAYGTPGLYDVKLIITDAMGCMDSISKSNYIDVKGPTANFGGTPVTGCAPLFVTFTDSSVAYQGNITGWKWMFGDGDSSTQRHPTHTYAVTGTYNVSLTVTDVNGCSHTLLKNGFITPTFPKPSFTVPALSCTGKTVAFTNTSQVVNGTYLWNFGDGNTSTTQHPVHQYTTEGTFTISLKVTDVNGCDSTLVVPAMITITDPVADIAADSVFSPCPPLQVNFEDNSTGNIVGWQWDFGDGSGSVLQDPGHVYSAPGVYDLKLIVTSAQGCTDTIIKNDFVTVLGPNGTFTFDPQTNCAGTNVNFFGQYTNTAVRTWDFGDGTVMVGPDTINYAYTNHGIFYPVVILDDGLGCIYSIPTRDSVMISMLHTDFSASTTYLCKQGSVEFKDMTTSFPGILSWNWDFGDGTYSTDKDPLHYYTTPGVYTVKLITTTITCVDSMVKTGLIVVDAGPQTDFSINAGPYCVPFNAQFQNTTVSDSAITSIIWNFDNGNTDTINAPAQLFDTSRTYNVSLIAVSITGCADTIVKPLTIHSLPVANAGADITICAESTTMLQGAGGITYSWVPAASLDNAGIATPVASPQGNTTYALTVTDANGCQDNDTMSIRVIALPVSTISADTAICLGNTIELNATGGDNYEWAPANSLSCSTCPNPVAAPQATTLYEVKVLNIDGCFVTDSVTITVHALPAGIAETEVTICEFDSIQLNAVGGISHFWTPSVGLSCTTCPAPMASPPMTTLYALQIVNQQGCGFIDTVRVVVNPVPVLTVQAPEYICLGQTADITATGADTYTWTPATGLNCADCSSPAATPAVSTTYYLEAASIHGCISRDTVVIEVKALPEVQTIDDLTLCKGDNIKLETTLGNYTSFTWSPAVGLNDTNTVSPVAGPTATTEYVIRATSSFGCIKSDSVTITSLTKVQSSVMADTAICFGQSVVLQGEVIASGNLGSQVVWSPVNDLERKGLTTIATPLESRIYSMITFSGSCIPDTQMVAITVNANPTIEIAPLQQVVTNTEVALTPVVPANVVSYNWSPSEGLSCGDCPKPYLLATETRVITLTVTNENKCTATTQVVVPVSGPCGEDVYVPNLFTPNGDEMNDQLYVRGLGLSGLKTFRVFDRWGNMMFETTDINESWDGTYKGKMLNAGVFVYQVEAICTNGQTYTKQGNVTLMR